MLKQHAMMYKFPTMYFSGYSIAGIMTPVLITMDAFRDLLESVASTVDGEKPEIEVPISRLLIRVSQNSTRFIREDIINNIKALQSDTDTIAVDTQFLIDSTDVASNVLMVIFGFIAFISLILCFFMLWISFQSNVLENSWELGVLRSLGLTSFQVLRVYTWESILLVLSATVTGTAIGATMSAAFGLEYDIFSEMPFDLHFPWPLFLFLFVSAIIFAIAGSSLAVSKITKKPIATVLRGG